MRTEEGGPEPLTAGRRVHLFTVDPQEGGLGHGTQERARLRTACSPYTDQNHRLKSKRSREKV